MSKTQELKHRPTFVSLYTGAGGLDLGFMAAGLDPVFSNDIFREAVATYTRMTDMLQPHGIAAVPHRIMAGDIREVIELPGKGCADLLIGGPPCQGFSVAGKMDPNDPRSRHVFDYLAMVERVQPSAFVMENVKALACNRRWRHVIAEIREHAARLGYTTVLHVLNAADYGVAQARERMFLIGTRNGIECPRPEPVGEPMSVRDMLAGLPALGEPGNDRICTAKVTPAKHPVLRPSPWAGMLFNGQGRPINLDGPCPTLPASMGGNRTPIIDQQTLVNGTRPWVQDYHARLMDGESPATVVPDRLRRLSVDEAAALQSFPRDMPWQGAQSAVYRQIGNAVPPRLAYHVACTLLDALGWSTIRTPHILERLTLVKQQAEPNIV